MEWDENGAAPRRLSLPLTFSFSLSLYFCLYICLYLSFFCFSKNQLLFIVENFFCRRLVMLLWNGKLRECFSIYRIKTGVTFIENAV